MHRSYARLAIVAGIVLAAQNVAVQGAAAQGAWYISGSAGAVLPFDYSRPITISNSQGMRAPGTNTTTYTAGEDVNIALGYRLPLGFRIEGELG